MLWWLQSGHQLGTNWWSLGASGGGLTPSEYLCQDVGISPIGNIGAQKKPDYFIDDGASDGAKVVIEPSLTNNQPLINTAKFPHVTPKLQHLYLPPQSVFQNGFLFVRSTHLCDHFKKKIIEIGQELAEISLK